jgi:hypothetical protein
MKYKFQLFFILILTGIIFIVLFIVNANIYSMDSFTVDTTSQSESQPLSIAASNTSALLLQPFLEEYADSRTQLKIMLYPEDVFHDIYSSVFINANEPDITMFEHPAMLDSLDPASTFVSIRSSLPADWRSSLEICKGPNAAYLSSPVGIKYYTVYYNNDILYSLGLSVDPLTMDHLIECLAAVQNAGINPVAVGAKDQSGLKTMLIQMCTVNDLSAAWQDASANFNRIKPYLSKEVWNLDSLDAVAAFKKGKTAFYFGTDTEYPSLLNSCDFDLGQINLSDDGGSIVWFDYVGMYAINSKSNQKLAALNLVKDLSGLSGLEWYRKNGYPASVRNAGYLHNWFYEAPGSTSYYDRISDLL